MIATFKRTLPNGIVLDCRAAVRVAHDWGSAFGWGMANAFRRKCSGWSSSIRRIPAQQADQRLHPLSVPLISRRPRRPRAAS